MKKIIKKKRTRKVTPQRRLTSNLLKKGIENSFGNVTTIAKNVGCERKTIYAWLDKSRDLQIQFDLEREKIIDLAENKLVENLNHGETSSIHFVLKTLGRNKGYYEKQEIQETNSLLQKLRSMTPAQRLERSKEIDLERKK